MKFDAQSDIGGKVLTAAEAVAELGDGAAPSAALLEILLGGTFGAESEGEGMAVQLSPLGHHGSAPSATALFNAFVYPNHPLRPRNALHRHYARRFQVLAHPGQPLADLDPHPGDLLLRVARGEGWGHVAVVASRGLHRYDRLGTAGLRGEGYPRLRPGLYIQVVELRPRRRRGADRFARRLCDGTGLVLADTLLLRPLPPGRLSREAEAESGYADDAAVGLTELGGCPLAEDVGFAEQPAPQPAPAPPAPAGPDSSVANRFIAAHPTRFCTPGQTGSATCQTLAAPRPIRRVVIHTLAVPSTARRSGIEAVVAGWQNAGRQASSHYLVDRDGTITQMVREGNVAFHTPNNNRDSIGIEHADVCNDPAPLTTQLYERSAALVRDLATRHGFAINNNTVAGHSQVNPNHGDPGPYWDWEYYFLLLAWVGLGAASRPIRLVTAAASRPAAPTGWQVQRRRAIANDHCASQRDPWGAAYWRAQSSATGTVAELSLVLNEACTYKVSLWWPDVAGANPAVSVDIEVGCLTSPCAGTSTQTVTVNQRPNAGRWNDVAVVSVTQTPAEVKVRWRRNSAQRGWILVDGVRLLKIGSCPGSPLGGGTGETETVMQPLTITVRPFVVLDRFPFDQATLPSFHEPIVERIARLIVASRISTQPIDTVRLVGHADPTGSTTHNFGLGSRRASEVKAKLLDAIRRLGPVPSGRLDIVPQSQGEARQVASNRTPEDRARNRRVEVFLPISCQSFFAQYDLRFLPGDSVFGIPAHPNLTEDEKQRRTADVNAMVRELLRRRDRRAVEALAARVPPADPLPADPAGDSLHSIAIRLSAAQIDLYREYFPDGSGGIDFERFQECFDQFANGELRSPIASDQAAGVGEPNGGFFFLFAEFAFLCTDSGIAVADWTQALRVFGKAQEIFMHVYRPAPVSPPPVGAALPACPVDAQRRPRARRRLDDYRNANFSPNGATPNVGRGQSNPARKQVLRAKYASMDLAALKRAARENMVRAQCMP